MTTPATPSADGAPATPPATPDETTTPQAGAATTPPAATPEITPEIQALIDEKATKASKDANREAASLRTRLKELEAAEQKRKDAELSDTERLQKERDDAAALAATATQTAQAAVLRAEVATKAAALNIVDVDAALALMGRENVTFGDDGSVAGVGDALDQLVAAKPYLVAGPNTPRLDPTNGGRGPGNEAPKVSDAQRLSQIVNPSSGDIWRR